jgi:hypothetical protein
MAESSSSSIQKHIVAGISTEKHLKEFSAALSLLGKIGKELIIDSEKDVLTLRSLNDAKCAFIAIELDRNFFGRFDHSSSLNNFCCKVPIKPLEKIFKNLKAISTLTLTVQTTNGNRHELIFEMACTGGMTRKHRFGYSDCDLMTAVFDEEVASHLRCAPKVFVSLLDHFYHSAELSIEASPSGFRVKSYHQQDESGSAAASSSSSGVAGGQVTKKYMSTGLTVNVAEFEEYEFASPDSYAPTGGRHADGAEGGEEEDFEELVVCSKELCAMLGFCDSTEIAYFYLYFTCGGQPIKLSSSRDSDGGSHRPPIKVELVLATLETRRQAIRKQTQQQQHQQHQQQQQQQRRQQRQQPPEPQIRQPAEAERVVAMPPQLLTAESEQVVVVHRKKKKRLLDDSDDDDDE